MVGLWWRGSLGIEELPFPQNVSSADGNFSTYIFFGRKKLHKEPFIQPPILVPTKLQTLIHNLRSLRQRAIFFLFVFKLVPSALLAPIFILKFGPCNEDPIPLITAGAKRGHNKSSC